MSPDQRRAYFRRWAAACARQDWNPKDAALRRDCTLEATGVQSTSALDQDGITKLFRWLELMADPDELNRAMPVANPRDEREADRRRRLHFAIGELRFEDAYIEKCATGLCRGQGATGWKELNADNLEKLRFTLTTRRRQKSGNYEARKEPWASRPSTKLAKARARTEPVTPRPEVAELLPF